MGSQIGHGLPNMVLAKHFEPILYLGIYPVTWKRIILSHSLNKIKCCFQRNNYISCNYSDGMLAAVNNFNYYGTRTRYIRVVARYLILANIPDGTSISQFLIHTCQHLEIRNQDTFIIDLTPPPPQQTKYSSYTQ